MVGKGPKYGRVSGEDPSRSKFLGMLKTELIVMLELASSQISHLSIGGPG